MQFSDFGLGNGLVSLLTSRVITNIAAGFFGVFLPIFLYDELFDRNITLVVLYYLASQALYLIFLPIGARFLNKFGFRHSLQLSTVCGASYYLGLRLLTPDTVHVVVPFLVIIITIWRILYWVPYHVDFAKFTSKKRRGKQLGTLYALQRLIGVAGPIVGGFLIATFSYGAAFAVGIGCILASLVPLSFLPRTNVQYEYGFFETFKMMFAKKYRYLTLSMIAYGADSAIGYIIWPIFLFIVFDGAYLSIGIFASLLVVVNVILQLIVGKQIDHHHKRKMIKFGVDLYALGWFFKAFVSSVGGVFAASTFHTFGSIMMRTPVDVMVYEKAADSGHYIDEFTVIREIALSMGRSGAIAVLAIVTIFAPIWTAFIFAAVIAFGISTLTKFTLEEVHI